MKKRGLGIKLLQGTVAILILALAVGAAAWLVKTKPAAQRQPLPKIELLVETIPAVRSENVVTIEAMGSVRAYEEIAVNPEVSGLVVWKNPNLISGGIVAADEALVRIDQRNYAVAVRQAEANLQKAQVEYEVELSRGAVAAEEWEMLSFEQVSDERHRALALREPQLRAAAAGLQAASNALARAELDMERTEIPAPFNALILEESVDRGQLVGPQSTLAKIAGTDAFLVEASLPAYKLDYLQWPDADGKGGAEVKIEYDLGERPKAVFDGRVARIVGDLGSSGRLARILIEVADPLRLEDGQGKQRLFLGAYVRCLIEGKAIADSYSLPSALVREGEKVWIMKPDNTLEIRAVASIWRQGGRVLIAEGLEEGERIVSSHIAVPLPGASLREKGSDAQQASPGKKGSAK